MTATTTTATTSTAAVAVELLPLTRRDLLPGNCPDESLRLLSFDNFADADTLALIVAELEDRGFDPFA